MFLSRCWSWSRVSIYIWTLERAVILSNLIQIFESNMQISLKNQISQRPVITSRRSGISQIISDVLIQRTDPWWKFHVNSTFRNIFTGKNSDVFNIFINGAKGAFDIIFI